MAPIAWTPPALNILLTPAILAAKSIAGCIFPFCLLGGVHSIISSHPAIFAGTASISTVEKSGAVPPGMYRPTFCMGMLFCQHVTPCEVCIFVVWNFCAWWNLAIFWLESNSAFFSFWDICVSASRISSCVTVSFVSVVWSNSFSYCLTALSPLFFTFLSIAWTVAASCDTSIFGRWATLVKFLGVGYFMICILIVVGCFVLQYHFFYWCYEYSLCTELFEFSNDFPEAILFKYGVYRTPFLVSERYDGWAFDAREYLCDLFDFCFWGVHHDIFFILCESDCFESEEHLV